MKDIETRLVVDIPLYRMGCETAGTLCKYVYIYRVLEQNPGKKLLRHGKCALEVGKSHRGSHPCQAKTINYNKVSLTIYNEI